MGIDPAALGPNVLRSRRRGADARARAERPGPLHRPADDRTGGTRRAGRGPRGVRNVVLPRRAPAVRAARRVPRRPRCVAHGRRSGPRAERPVQHRRGAVFARASRCTSGCSRPTSTPSTRSICRSACWPVPRSRGTGRSRSARAAPTRAPRTSAVSRSSGNCSRTSAPRSASCRGNLTDPLFLAGERPYDLIICRNLFIYLTPDAKHAGDDQPRPTARDSTGGCASPRPRPTGCRPAGSSPEGPTEFGVYRRVGVGSAIHTIARPSARGTARRPQPPHRRPRAAAGDGPPHRRPIRSTRPASSPTPAGWTRPAPCASDCSRPPNGRRRAGASGRDSPRRRAARTKRSTRSARRCTSRPITSKRCRT